MRFCLLGLLSSIGLAIGSWQTPGYAHGAILLYRPARAIAIQAVYDSGAPMAAAQVTVFAPDAPTEPWLQGTTDTTGQFSFMPDPARPGAWEVQVRQAGHGDIISIPAAAIASLTDASVETDFETIAGSGVAPGATLSPAQITLTAAAGVWGFIGTACFFARKRS